MTKNIYSPANITVSKEDAEIIISLRLLIARAANKDSLAWWDDESLANHSAFLLDRIFPIAPQTAARSLALKSALYRHQAALESESRPLHLFRLDDANQDELAARQVALSSISVPDEPITSMAQLKTMLVQIIGDPQPYKRIRPSRNHGFQIEITVPPAGVSKWRHRALTLAWAYLEGAQNQPVFPFILE